MKTILTCFIACIIFCTVSRAQIPAGAVGYYRLDGHAFDSSIYANHGVVTGVVTPTTDRHGNNPGANSFDGSSGHLDMGNPAVLSLTDSLTIAAWILPMQSPNWSGIASKWTADGYYLGINPATNRLRFNLGNGNILEGSIVSYGNWMHVAATFDGTTMRIYENGVLADSLIASQPASATNASFYIGAQFDLPTNKFLGSIDEVLVYGRPLDQVEINQIISHCSPTPVLTTTATDVLCHGNSSGTATVNATGGTAPYFYMWSNGENTQTATALTAGTHTVIVTDDSSCVAIATVVINEPATAIGATISSSSTNATAPNCNGSVSANVTGGTPPLTISWSSGTTTNLCEDWYTVTITDANNCVLTDSVFVNLITGIEEINAAGISVYPNPVNDILFITSEKFEIGEVKIFDVTGKLVLTETTQHKNFNFNISELNNGIYFLERNGQQIKLVKQ